MMNESELKVGMWVKYIYGGNWIRRVLALGLGKEGDIAEVGDKNNTYCYDDLEPATCEEIAKELGWELAKAEKTRQEILSEYALCNIEDDDYTYQMEKNDIGIRKLLAEIESGVDDE